MYFVSIYAFNSIEDPFETHYDVAHVIKSAQMAYLRKELLVRDSLYLFPDFPSQLLCQKRFMSFTQRAHTLASRMFVPINNTPTASSNGGNISPGDDVLAASVDPENFLSLLCEPCEPPAFTNSARDKLAAAEGSIAVEPAPVQG